MRASSTETGVLAAPHRGAVCAFCLLGVVCCGYGPAWLLVGMFVGPHVVATGLVALLIGIAGLIVSVGLAVDAWWARIAGIALACAVSATLGYGAVSQTIAAIEAGGPVTDAALYAALPVAFMAPFPVVAVSLFRVEIAGRRGPRPERHD